MTKPTGERIGKHIGGFVYVHVDAIRLLPAPARRAVKLAETIAGVRPRECNVVKIDTGRFQRVSFLAYEPFDKAPFPALLESVVVDLVARTARVLTFRASHNPPILHRKELTLRPDHPSQRSFAALTAALEERGLFSESSRIGCRRQWEEKLAAAGVSVLDHILRDVQPTNGANLPAPRNAVARHRTAIVRDRLSTPMQALARYGYLSPGRTVLDYGCGQGDDVRALRLGGIEAVGWDPHHSPDTAIAPADIVNVGFVLNVIEDPAERVDVIKRAFGVTGTCLSVAVITGRPADAVAQRPYGDGFLTQRGTFQKYYSQQELKSFLEDVLDREAIPVGPGIFFVFPDEIEEQRFLVDRQRRRPSCDILGIRLVKRPSERAHGLEKWRPLLEPFWQRMLELGRTPDERELPSELLASLQTNVGPLRRAERLCSQLFSVAELESAAQRRRDDLLVYFALSQFGRRKPYGQLPIELQRDVRAFFGSHICASDAGRDLLFSLGRPDVIAKACRHTSDSGIGFSRDGDALLLHSTLVERLPPELRCYVACATKLYGGVETADLVKIHARSGRLSLLYYEDFDHSPLPRLRRRVRIDLRTQRTESVDRTDVHSPQILLMKSRYMPSDRHGYQSQRRFDEQLRALNLHLSDHDSPTLSDFAEALRLAGYRLSGFNLLSSGDPTDMEQVAVLPNLEEKVGRHFCFSELCEAGDTFAQYRPDNHPRDADTYEAMRRLCVIVLDPIVDVFGKIEITYGFSGPNLSRLIHGGIDCRLDQHAGHERRRTGRLICDRGGQAVDFRVPGVDSKTVADWIVSNTEFDRLYFYGANRPLHVSVGPQQLRQIVILRENSAGRRIPRVVNREGFLGLGTLSY